MPTLDPYKKPRHRAKPGKVSVAFWAPVAAVIALFALIWAVGQSDVGSAPVVVANGQADGRSQAGSRTPKPAAHVKAVGNVHSRRDPSPGSGIRQNSDVEQQIPAAQTDSPSESPEQAAQKSDDSAATPTTASPRQPAASSEPAPPPSAGYPSEHTPPSRAVGKSTPLPKDSFVVSLARDGAGCIWTGTEDLGVFRYDPSATESAQWTEFTTADGLGDDNAYALCVDRLNRMWVGHLNHGVSVYNGQPWMNYDVPDGPIGERIFSIAADPKSGDVWIATSAGLTRYSLEKDTWTYYTRDDGLPSDQIQSLAFDAKGNLYAGTQCDGLAIARGLSPLAKSAQQKGTVPLAPRWTQVVGPDTVPLSPAGPGLPSNLINDVLVSRSGTVFVATTCGLAASSDHGKNWSFIRGADWGAKVKGLYGGPPRGWREGPAALLLTEDYCTRLAEDDSGLLWIGHRQTGYEAIDPRSLQRRFDSRGDKKAKGAEKASPDYVTAMRSVQRHDPIVGWYGNGLAHEVEAFSSPTKSHPSVATLSPARHPTPAAPPTVDELNALLARVGTVPTLRQVNPTVVEIPDDWRTEGDWLGRYGRYWACCCAMCSPADFIRGAGPESVEYAALMGPNHPEGNDSLRYWVHWLATDDRRSLEMPPTYLDSRIKMGLTTRNKNRRQSEWDDHSEVYPQALDGPHVFCTLRVPAGQFYLSLYDFNKDGHAGKNRFRDYRVSVRPHDPRASLRYVDGFGQQPELAAGRIHDFWGGVWKRYFVQGPIDLSIEVGKNGSLNTILAGVAIDYVDERPIPYFCTYGEWNKQLAALSEARKALLDESAADCAMRCRPQADPMSAGDRLFEELERLRLRNAPWLAAEGRRYYLPLARLYSAQQAAADGHGPRQRLATCRYQLCLFRGWEDLQRAGNLIPARDIENALRWNGLSYSNSGLGYYSVSSYLGRE